MLNKEQFCKALNTYCAMCNEEDKILTVLDGSVEWVPGKWITNYYTFLTDIFDEKARNWIDWYCFETNFGHDREMAKVTEDNGYTWYITTPEKLYDFLMTL